jgi:hypothetical protein
MKHIWNKVTLERVYVFILLMIFGGIVLQGPISVGLGSLWPHYILIIKAWAEVGMVIASILLLVLLYKKGQLKLLKDPLMLLAIAYVLIHLILLAIFWQGKKASVSGLIIDLRYVVFFGLTYITIKLYPLYRSLFIKIGIAGALVMVIFSILQVTILPADILKYIGYNNSTIVPYLTVDQNHSYIRINSTLRGPNPVGAYTLIVLTLLIAALYRKAVVPKKTRIVMAILAVGGVIALWASYSRSALLAAILSALIVVLTVSYKRIAPRIWVGALTAIIVVILAVFTIGGSTFVSNIFLHDNPNGGSATKSDQGHLSSLSDGAKLVIRQPLGAGVGSTGSASLYTKSPLVIENQYLFIAHEAGWIGLIAFMVLFVWILKKLWRRKKDWLAIGVFASGIGLALIGLLLPVWVDDTVSIVWWGLAGIALGSKRND